MVFQEPKVEFVQIDALCTDPIVPSNCDQNTTKKGSVETCTGPDAPYSGAVNCCREQGESNFAFD